MLNIIPVLIDLNTVFDSDVEFNAAKFNSVRRKNIPSIIMGNK